jgi:hypothetical protein
LSGIELVDIVHAAIAAIHIILPDFIGSLPSDQTSPRWELGGGA